MSELKRFNVLVKDKTGPVKVEIIEKPNGGFVYYEDVEKYLNDLFKPGDIVTMEAFPEYPTIRDKFAMAALNGFVSSIEAEDRVIASVAAKFCYELADAMMEARNK